MTAVLPVVGAPGLEVAAFSARFPAPLAQLAVGPDPAARLAACAGGPGHGEELRRSVRDALRAWGYRPTGRGKPSSEYLAGAAAQGRWPVINAAVDGANLASLESGLPISLVDADRAAAPWSVRIPAAGAQYVFNGSGQVIDVGGLPCLCDALGPCANAVKDAQRTKTDAATTRVLAVVWGCEALAGRAAAVAAALAAEFAALGAEVKALECAAG